MAQHRHNPIHSEPLPLYKAKVVSVDEEAQKGRIKVRVLPQLKDVDESLLPWAEPLVASGMHSDEYSFTPPIVGSNIWCIFTDKYWKDPYWIPGYFIEGFFDYDSVKSSLDEVSELTDTAYPNVRFTHMPQGNIHFYNADNGEMGTIHNSGSYSIFDVNGNVFNYSSGSVKLYNDNGSIELKDNGQVDINNGNLTVDT